MSKSATPLMQQYQEIKARHRDAILFFRMGDFFEMFYEDAETAARVLGLTLTSRNNGGAAEVPLAGVPVSLTHLDLDVTGMTCASCATRIEKKLNRLDGVEATVNFALERARVDFDPDKVAPEDLLAAVEAGAVRIDAAAAGLGAGAGNTPVRQQKQGRRQACVVPDVLAEPGAATCLCYRAFLRTRSVSS